MKNILLDITNQLNDPVIRLLDTVDAAARLLNIPYVIVGATARDMVFQHGYGRRLERATADIDMAIHVRDWSEFQRLHDHLIAAEFRKGNQTQRFYSADEMPLDIVPFGGIENAERQLAWPPDGNEVMNMMGFTEACASTMAIKIQNEPPVTIPVATPAAMAILKLVSWSDRTAEKRKKDARDLIYLLTQYEHIPDIRDRLYDNVSLLEKYQFDCGLAGAYLLGVDAASIALPDTKAHISTMLSGGMTSDKLTVDTLLRESMERFDQATLETRFVWLEAFRDGFSRS